MAKADKKLKTKRERQERRFFPRPTAAPAMVYGIGGLGALLLGAGAWAQWLRVAVTTADSSAPYGTYVLAAGIVSLGVAIWFGTSGEPTLRVGDAGLASEKGGLRRLPWFGVTGVSFDTAGGGAVVARGTDEGGSEIVVRAPLGSHPQAAAWIAHEARERIPALVTFGDEVILPARNQGAGERLALDPIQIVGKRCAASRTIIAFEPDARICTRCERVYHKDHVPETCPCGASMLGLRRSVPDGGHLGDETSEAAVQDSHA